MLKPGTVVEILKTCPWNEEGDLPLGIVVGHLDPKDRAAQQRRTEDDASEKLVCTVCVVCTVYMPGMGPNEKMYFLQEEMLKVVPAAEVPDVIFNTIDEEFLMSKVMEHIGIVPPAAGDGAMGKVAKKPEDPRAN